MMPETWDTKDAVVGLLVGAMYADGTAFRSEYQTATLHLEALEGVHVSASDVRRRLEPLAKAYVELGPDRFLDRCVGSLPKDLHGPAFRGVVAVVGADHDISEREERYLRDLARKLDLAEAEAETLLGRN